ncbi:hypothetical protein D9613_012047 [Agrocybe pediades]|uniref:CxC2-like cysteine cluster KDZ transposase-associated domain-containing protein n=1 Tax=Agrocybe pediades TaxID=84607 RepID=A0A8H4VHS7_9AGAR|nr:hypothetical protein D9613_012047 [Agrocybe pediades]
MAKKKLTGKDARKRRLEELDEDRAAENPRKRSATSTHLNQHATFELRTPSVVSRHVFRQTIAPVVPIVESTKTPVDLPPAQANVEDVAKEKRSQLSQELEDFENAKSELLDYLFELQHHPSVGQPCGCSRGNLRLVGCGDCAGHNLTCHECFIDMHRTNPTHWARVWQTEGGFFTKSDISTLRPGGYSIPLGHSGERCPHPFNEEDAIGMIIVDHNGVHKTRVHYCTCAGIPNRVKQLVQFGLFPASMRSPRTAFTLTVLRQFHIHHLESKESAFDYIGSLRRLTDNFFATSISDPYEQFLKVMRFWRVLMATKRLGQSHGIDKHLPQRVPGNLQVFCPACLQPGINTEEGWDQAPAHLKHLRQLQMTADGNFHTNRYMKHGSSDDYSLFDGRSYYGNEGHFMQYLRDLPAKDIDEKISCAVKAVTNQNKAIDNLDQTGTVNIQCPHCIVLSTVDLQRGERFANTDYAVALALKQNTTFCNPDQAKKIDFIFSYDISCAYGIKMVQRFQERFPDLAATVEEFRFLVPLVHIHNHKENCMYLYSSTYTSNCGHFHGESAEFEWPEVNQLAPQARQMNNGSRQDVYNDLHGDWNHKKVVNMPTLLLANLIHARKTFAKKRQHYITLTKLYADHVHEWNKRDREARRFNSAKEIECVFRHTPGKVPSQKRLYEGLLKIAQKPQRSESVFADLDRHSATLALKIINDGLSIEHNQREILQLLSRLEIARRPTARLKPSEVDDPVEIERLEAKIEASRQKLQPRLKKWKSLQKEFYGATFSILGSEIKPVSNINEPESERLLLPSYLAKDLSDISGESVRLNALFRAECDLRKGRAFDCIRRVQCTTKTLSAMTMAKPCVMNNYSARTRSEKQIEDIERLRDLQIADYNGCRDALVALTGLDSYEAKIFPIMTVADTYRNRTHISREVGSSTRHEGRIYNVGITAGVKVPLPSTLHFQSAGETPETGGSSVVVQTQGTNLSKPRKRKLAKERKGAARRVDIEEMSVRESEALDKKEKESGREHGWIWRLGSMQDFTEKDIRQWSEESDAVQWFRAEAEMKRWQEEHEIVQAQFQRCIRAYHTMSTVWTTMADEYANTDPGRVAYAKKTAARYTVLEQEARQKFAEAGYADKVKAIDKGIPLATLIEADREANAKDMNVNGILLG